MAKNRRKSVTCPNCGYSFDGIDNYCPNCGQENHSHHAPFKHIFIELIESLTHFDTKFLTSLKTLLFKPGLLTKDYNEDKRARYVPPVRLYVFVSFVFFFLLSLLSKSDEGHPLRLPRATSQSTSEISVDSHDTLEDSVVSRSRGPRVFVTGKEELQDSMVTALGSRTDVTTSTVDSMIKARMPDAGWIEKLFMRQNIRTELGLITREAITHAFLKNIGITVFILMPIFALILKLLYIRRKRFYIEHLIFSVHYHAFVFIILILAYLLYKITDSDLLSVLLSLATPVYCTLALKRVYQNSWAKTILKSMLLTLTYGFCISIAMLITFIVSFAQS